MSLSKSRFIEMFGDPIKNEKRWAQLTLNSVCDGIGDGLHGTPEYDDSGDFYFINGNNLINGEIVITPSTKKVNEEVFKKYYRNISSNALLLSINGTLGKIAFYNNEAITLGKSACYINLKTFVNKYFVFELMKTDHFLKYLEENSTKSTIKNVSLKTIRNFQLISPPENLQNDFISFSKKIDKSKFLLQKILEKLELLKKSRFIEMFGDLKENQNYRTILFSQCTKSMIKGPFGSDMKKSLYVPKGKDTYKVYIQLNAIQRNQSLGNYYISKDYFDKKISRFEVKPNDFIITCDGTLGKLLQLDENMEKGVISSSLLKITLDETVIDSSFFEILWTNVILPNLSRYTRNACLVHLPSVSTIGNLEFHLPDLYLQKEYTKLVKQIDKSKLVIQKSLEDLVGKS